MHPQMKEGRPMNASKKKLTAWVLTAVLGFALADACGAPTGPTGMGPHAHGDAAVVAASDR